MSNDADLERLRTEWNALFDKVLVAGQALGQAKASQVLQEAWSKLGGAPEVRAPAVVAQADGVPRPASGTPARRERRAPAGSVQEAVDRILRGSSIPLGPLRIVKIAEERGETLKDSSVRMALVGLRDKGKAEQVGDAGEWRSVSRPFAGGFFSESPEPLSRDDESETHSEEATPA